MREIYNRFIEQGKIITAGNINNQLPVIDHRQRMLLEQFSRVVENMEQKDP